MRLSTFPGSVTFIGTSSIVIDVIIFTFSIPWPRKTYKIIFPVYTLLSETIHVLSDSWAGRSKLLLKKNSGILVDV